jgi:protein tyrosine phosphatase (PTP) superfamily phosphohydrolase (DUF442 family)
VSGLGREISADERRWLRRLQRALDAQPASLMVYCHGGGVATVLDSVAALEAGGFDLRDAILDEAPTIRTVGWVAGDF